LARISKATVNGWVTVERQRWEQSTGESIMPVDALMGLAEATVSRGLCELCCRLNRGSTSFAEASEHLGRAAQVKISRETLRQVVQAEGRKVIEAQASGVLPPSFQAKACQTTTPQGAVISRIYESVDGVKVPTVTDAEKQKRRAKVREKRRKQPQALRAAQRALPAPRKGADNAWKEVRLVTAYDQTMEHRHVTGTLGNHEAAGRLLLREARRLGFDAVDQAVAVVDGAPWIENQFHAKKVPVDALGLDFYHLSEHVHAARREVFGQDDAAGQTHAGDLLHTVRHEGYEPFWSKLIAWRSGLKSPRKKTAVDGLMQYASAHREMIRYPEFEKKGWQIGSGPMESMCKTAPRRLKHSGMRWDHRNVEPMLAMECLAQSGQWNLHWKTPVATIT
jgi:hypothetical protein